jgi:hypothetical protein
MLAHVRHARIWDQLNPASAASTSLRVVAPKQTTKMVGVVLIFVAISCLAENTSVPDLVMRVSVELAKFVWMRVVTVAKSRSFYFALTAVMRLRVKRSTLQKSATKLSRTGLECSHAPILASVLLTVASTIAQSLAIHNTLTRVTALVPRTLCLIVHAARHIFMKSHQQNVHHAKTRYPIVPRRA